jgi:NAD(P)-dependent dehydrogenase (short-subunit alcohol dehydrogenase family)
MGRLEGRVAIVTGAGGGIGRAHALLMAAEGARVLVNDTGTRSGSDAASVVAEIGRAGGTAVADTTSATWSGSDAIVAAAVDAFGRLDILVNNANTARANDIWRLTEAEWDLALDVNLKGYFAMIRAAAPHMCRQGWGAIVNTSSASGFGHPSYVTYSSAKEGIIGLTRTVAKELGRFGVRCNAIRPSAAGLSTREYEQETARWNPLLELTMGARPGVAQKIVFDATVRAPHQVAPLVVWLCTDAAKNVNGRTFHVGGAEISRYSEPQRERVIYHEGGWDLDALDDVAPGHLVEDLTNPYTFDDHPELKVFED